MDNQQKIDTALKKEKKRIALFGGSFNPIHFGHIYLADYVLQHALADEVWLMVSPQNPLKEQGDLLPESFRYEMATIATKDYPQIKVSDFEFHLPRPSFTWNTLEALAKSYPDVEFSLLVGADNWQIFHKWAHHEEILQQYKLLVYPREGYNIDTQALPPSVRLINAPMFPYSSTEIRQAIAHHKDYSMMLPKNIAQRLEDYLTNLSQ